MKKDLFRLRRVTNKRILTRVGGKKALVLTTESQYDKKMVAKEAGATGWLVKPFKNRQLVDVVQKLAT